MGMDFAALLRLGEWTCDTLETIAELESGVGVPPLLKVVDQGSRYGHAFADDAGDPACWRPMDDWDRILPARPTLPTLGAVLEHPSGFGLVFGSDAILITHTVRWFLFLNNEDWHPVLIQAVGWFFTAFQATDCVITNDEHPVIQAFWKGAAFKSALDHAQALGEAEAETLQEMCIDEGLDEELGLEGPDGWYPMSLWSTKGYWRPNLPHLLRRDAGDQNA